MAAGTAPLGICQWFHYQDDRILRRCIALMRELGVRHLRTGISWADFHRPQGRQWYDRQMEALAEFEVLLSVWHTPPSIAEGSVCAGPPRRLQDYADFIEQVIDLYGDKFAHVELWNEPNNRYKWDFPKFDPDWSKFGAMISGAAAVARGLGKPTVLGGMIPVDPDWLRLMRSHGALDDIDIIAVHAFPEMWWPNHPNWDWYDKWRGWEQKIAALRELADGRPIWVTETGLATWNLDEAREERFELQSKKLEEATQAPVERLYWYSLLDLDPNRDAIEGFHVDENEYHMGLVDWQGHRKPAFSHMQRLLDHADSTSGRLRS